GGALLDVSRLIGHQYRARIAKVLDHAGPKVVAHAVSVPFRTGQEVLHPVRGRIAGMLRDGPAILARQLRQQPKNECPRPAPRLYPAETPPDPHHQLIKYPRPPARVYAVASGHQKIITSR